MNIMEAVEAVNSGKRIRRKNNAVMGRWWHKDLSTFDKEDVLATDWEIEETIELSEDQFDEALIEASQRTTIGGDLYVELKKRLFNK